MNSLFDRWIVSKVLLKKTPSSTLKISLSSNIPDRSKWIKLQDCKISFSLNANSKDALDLTSKCPEISSHYNAVVLRGKYPINYDKAWIGKWVDYSCRFVRVIVFCLKNLIKD